MNEMDPNERLKPLDVVKILIGIYSNKGCIKRFSSNERIFGRLKEYDYLDVLNISTSYLN
jgi:hypothetical protein